MTLKIIQADSKRRYDDAKRSHEVTTQVAPHFALIDSLQDTEITNLFVTDKQECWVTIKTTWDRVALIAQQLPAMDAAHYRNGGIATIDTMDSFDYHQSKGYTGTPIAPYFIRTEIPETRPTWRKIHFTWFTQVGKFVCKIICELPHDKEGNPLYAKYKPPVKGVARTNVTEYQKEQPGFWYWAGSLNNTGAEKINYADGPCYYWPNGVEVVELVQNAIEL